MSVNLHGLHDDMDPIIKLNKEFSLTNLHYNLAKLDYFEVFHCNGLLLCTNRDNVHVWNPCTGQTEWIQARSVNSLNQNYALGYEINKLQNYKMLRILHRQTFELEIYEFNSCSWRALDSVTPDFQLERDGISVKGNTYWLASDKELEEDDGEEIDEESNQYFLISFDFTTEIFGPHICLPFTGYLYRDTLSLSSVREEELSVLFQDDVALTLEIWITNNITETNALSWSKFFKIHLNITPPFLNCVSSFFIDEENKVAVCCDDVAGGGVNTIVFIIGENRWTQVDLGVGEGDFFSRLFSYVPSLVQI
ncbi:unnamed protein product [Microthlaspi erraticum]|uniref:F-box associated beta-propeller type 1 domain-containing protein n=1 Tax=Microthlaspi erraticum TaxID=1685480 RepID=A0A6D2KQ83_9BRAS|nr:unnamed protein product [Microthlaspi erraticum]